MIRVYHITPGLSRGIFKFFSIFSRESAIFAYVYILSLETCSAIYYNVAYRRDGTRAARMRTHADPPPLSRKPEQARLFSQSDRIPNSGGISE